MEATAPLVQIMNIQLEDSPEVRPSWPATAMCSGTAPKAYHTKAVSPAHNAGALISRANVGSFIDAPWDSNLPEGGSAILSHQTYAAHTLLAPGDVPTLIPLNPCGGRSNILG